MNVLGQFVVCMIPSFHETRVSATDCPLPMDPVWSLSLSLSSCFRDRGPAIITCVQQLELGGSTPSISPPRESVAAPSTFPLAAMSRQASDGELEGEFGEGAEEASATTSSLDENLAGESLVCCTCQRITPRERSVIVIRAKTSPKDVVRCKKCHALRARCDRLVKSRGSLADWTSVPEEEKKTFYKMCQDICGEELVMKMTQCILHSTKTSSLAQFNSKGHFMDKDDLEKLYEGKPEQLKSVMDNARKFECPVRKTTLYENMDYTSALVDTEERTEERKRKIDFAQGPPGKTPKPKGKAKARAKANVQGGGAKKMKVSVKKKIEKKLGIADTVRGELTEVLSSVPGPKGDLVPVYVVCNAKDALEKLLQAIGEGKEVLAAEEGDSDQIIDSLKQATDKASAAKAKLMMQLDEASQFLNTDADNEDEMGGGE